MHHMSATPAYACSSDKHRHLGSTSQMWCLQASKRMLTCDLYAALPTSNSVGVSAFPRESISAALSAEMHSPRRTHREQALVSHATYCCHSLSTAFQISAVALLGCPNLSITLSARKSVLRSKAIQSATCTKALPRVS